MASFVQEPHGVMIVLPAAFAVTHREEYVHWLSVRSPTAYGFSTFVRAGGFLAYSLDYPIIFAARLNT